MCQNCRLISKMKTVDEFIQLNHLMDLTIHEKNWMINFKVLGKIDRSSLSLFVVFQLILKLFIHLQFFVPNKYTVSRFIAHLAIALNGFLPFVGSNYFWMPQYSLENKSLWSLDLYERFR